MNQIRALRVLGVALALSLAATAVVSAEGVKHTPDPVAASASPTTRGDDAVTGAVKASFGSESSVNSENIEVMTDQGVVHLTGSVGSEEEKLAAAQLATDIEGVRKVDTSELHVETSDAFAESEDE